MEYTFEDWCAHHNLDPTNDDLRYRYETFVWYTEAQPKPFVDFTP